MTNRLGSTLTRCMVVACTPSRERHKEESQVPKTRVVLGKTYDISRKEKTCTKKKESPDWTCNACGSVMEKTSGLGMHMHVLTSHDVSSRYIWLFLFLQLCSSFFRVHIHWIIYSFRLPRQGTRDGEIKSTFNELFHKIWSNLIVKKPVSLNLFFKALYFIQ